jgi:hypothetical protein
MKCRPLVVNHRGLKKDDYGSRKEYNKAMFNSFVTLKSGRRGERKK